MQARHCSRRLVRVYASQADWVVFKGGPGRGGWNQAALRSADAKDEPEVEAVDSPILWFNDSGNIIIRSIPDTDMTPPQRTMYKVHKYVLAMHCSAFASLFDGPQDAFAVGSEHRDGLPIMDDPEELESFLSALYRPGETHAHCRPSSAEPWEAFPDSYYGILRLAFKYDASEIFGVVLPAVKDQWPSELAAWDRLRVPTSETELFRVFRYPDPGPVIRLGVECSIPDILPLAYYAVSSILTGQKDFKERADILSEFNLTAAEVRTVSLGQMAHGDQLQMSDIAETAVNCSHKAAFCRKAVEERLLAKRAAFWRSLPQLFALDAVVSPNWGSAGET
ncbi:hypothetical protein FA95DRAFT_1594853 [Auriscalpium vulgare]|uniref:Uncharacterized protein n=1 Tax=Auriscalpium vulgare TaxID=40419 RepID=A0ACB8RXS2_9AGAM|nr:hypothetical protein FA95DRAFT_1594853 [Auriscalpium vulgare]